MRNHKNQKNKRRLELVKKKRIKELIQRYGYCEVNKYRQWDNRHYSAIADGVTVVVDLRTCELFEWNSNTKKLVQR
ncbi:hypothetical protein [Enterococcus hailinensis]|uniref:hypothetical protein n=1 Tax=Enterococcus hailinensis TaxID=3238988 RepID=UPI0038B23B68